MRRRPIRGTAGRVAQLALLAPSAHLFSRLLSVGDMLVLDTAADGAVTRCNCTVTRTDRRTAHISATPACTRSSMQNSDRNLSLLQLALHHWSRLARHVRANT